MTLTQQNTLYSRDYFNCNKKILTISRIQLSPQQVKWSTQFWFAEAILPKGSVKATKFFSP